MAKKYVVDGAKLKCNLGVAPSTLTVLPDRIEKLTGKRKANVKDCTIVHIAPFGACKVTSPPKPCIPLCLKWLGGKPDNQVQGEDALLDSSKVVCMAGGGMIEITDCGQIRDGYDTLNDAAEAWANEVNQTSIDENLEYSSQFYMEDGKYKYTTPLKGTEAGASIGPVPDGTTSAGIIHSHGGYDPKYKSEEFSTADKSVSDSRKVPIYVSTPGGTLQKYDNATKKITTLSTDMPRDPKTPK
jgi:hypothetical protein